MTSASTKFLSRLLLPFIYLLELYPSTLITLFSILPYFRCLFYSEWYIDELFAIVRNEDAKNESSWTSVFTHDFWGNPISGGWTHKSYRPLTVLLYCLEFWIAGEIKPQGLRALSILTHWINSVLLYAVCWKFLAVQAGESDLAIETKAHCYKQQQQVLNSKNGKKSIKSQIKTQQTISSTGETSVTDQGDSSLSNSTTSHTASGSIENINLQSISGPSATSQYKLSIKPINSSTTTSLISTTILTKLRRFFCIDADMQTLQYPNGWSITLAACLFAAHPVHVENIVYLVGRADMKAVTVWCLLFFIYLDFPNDSRLHFPLLWLLTTIAGFCKESGFMMLPFLTCIEVTRKRGNILTAMLNLVSFLIIFSIRSHITGGTSAGFSFVDTPVQYSGSWLARTLTYSFQHSWYIKLFLMPWNLSWDYSYDAIPILKAHFDDLRVLHICTFYTLVLMTIVWFSCNKGKNRNLQSSHLGLVGVFLVAVPFLPASNLIFIVGVTVGERLLYTCTMGIVFLVPAVVNGMVQISDSDSEFESSDSNLSNQNTMIRIGTIFRLYNSYTGSKKVIKKYNQTEGEVENKIESVTSRGKSPKKGARGEESIDGTSSKILKKSDSSWTALIIDNDTISDMDSFIELQDINFSTTESMSTVATKVESEEHNTTVTESDSTGVQNDSVKRTKSRSRSVTPRSARGNSNKGNDTKMKRKNSNNDTNESGTVESVNGNNDSFSNNTQTDLKMSALWQTSSKISPSTRGLLTVHPNTYSSIDLYSLLLSEVSTESSEAQSESESDINGKSVNSIPKSLLVKLLFLILAIWLAIFTVNCDTRVKDWQNRLRLFEVDTAAWPRSLKSHHQLGTVYHRMNKFEEALVHYNITISLHDDNSLTDYCIAQVYLETSRFHLAIPYFEKIMKSHGIGFGGYNLFALYVDYGFTLTILNRKPEDIEYAVNLLEKGLQINHDVPYG